MRKLPLLPSTPLSPVFSSRFTPLTKFYILLDNIYEETLKQNHTFKTSKTNFSFVYFYRSRFAGFRENRRSHYFPFNNSEHSIADPHILRLPCSSEEGKSGRGWSFITRARESALFNSRAIFARVVGRVRPFSPYGKTSTKKINILKSSI